MLLSTSTERNWRVKIVWFRVTFLARYRIVACTNNTLTLYSPMHFIWRVVRAVEGARLEIV